MSDEAADEVAQEVLVKLLRAMQAFRYDADQSFRAWLKRVTSNAVVDSIRKKRPDRAVGGSAAGDGLQNVPDWRAEGIELGGTLSDELNRDLFNECEPFVRKRVSRQTWGAFCSLRQGKKGKQVAEELNMSVAAVYRAKTRVLQLFRDEVAMQLKNK